VTTVRGAQGQPAVADVADDRFWRLKQLLAMLKVGIIGFGGGSALIPVMSKELVGPNRLTLEQFTQDTVIANITPGALPVKLAVLAGVRMRSTALAAGSALAVALPGTLATVALLSVFTAIGPGAIATIEAASLGITAFILYLLSHYVVSVLAPVDKPHLGLIAIAVAAFAVTGTGKTLALVQTVSGVSCSWAVPELSALGLILVALGCIGSLTVVQSFTGRKLSGTAFNGGHHTKAAVKSAACMLAVAVFGFALLFILPSPDEQTDFLSLVAFSTVSSFGGGEAYVGVADGFFVASGAVDSDLFYGQIVPVANALPGPILVKIVAAIGWATGIAHGQWAAWLLAIAATLVSVGLCTAIATAFLSGYDRASSSLLISNISSYILPVICGLLVTTSISMLHSNVRIGIEAGVPPVAVLIGTVVLACLVPLLRRVVSIPDIVFIAVFGALSFVATIVG
jgi:chromate transporter